MNNDIIKLLNLEDDCVINYIQFSVISVRTIYIRVVYQRKWLHT